MSYTWSNLFKPTPAKVRKWLLALKALIGSISVGSYVVNNMELAFWLLVGGAVLDFLAQFFGSDEDIN